MMDREELAQLFAALNMNLSEARVDMIFAVCAGDNDHITAGECL